MVRVIRLAAPLALALALATSCEEKPGAPTAPPGDGAVNDTSWVPLSPAIDGLNNPEDIFIGSEPFVYVAEHGANRVAMFDLAGRLVGYSRPIARPVAIAQDGHFNLLVCAELDTAINGQNTTIGAIYKIDLREARHDISQAPVRLVYSEPGRPERRFTGISSSTAIDNGYLVCRTGPANASSFDPDTQVLLLSESDRVLSPLATLRPIGNALNSLAAPSGLRFVSPSGRDFGFVQTGEQMQFKVQILRYTSGENAGWEQQYNPAQNPTDLMIPRRFSRPEGIAFDNQRSVYIADGGTDSVLVFNSSGRQTTSLGGSGSAPGKLRNPSAVAWFDRTLWVADRGNGRVVRFRLSTDN